MTEAEYRTLVATAIEFRWEKDEYTGYCENMRKRLKACGLRLVYEEPDPLLFYYQMVYPPPKEPGGVDWITPADDPHSWPVPSWIVPDVASQEAALLTPVAIRNQRSNAKNP